MDFLAWLLQGILELWTQALNVLTPVIQGLFGVFGLQIDEATAQFVAALVLLVFVAWLFRRVFWGKPKMFEPQKIVLKTEKSPVAVVTGDVMHWIGWGILLGLGLFAAISAVTGGMWFESP